jgi:ADP-ribosylglycohydrolase
VVAALALSGGDYSRGITLAVAAGWDADCNGATVGSVLGAMAGADGIPPRWSDPLHDRVQSYVIGEGQNRISDLATRTCAVLQRAAPE